MTRDVGNETQKRVEKNDQSYTFLPFIISPPHLPSRISSCHRSKWTPATLPHNRLSSLLAATPLAKLLWRSVTSNAPKWSAPLTSTITTGPCKLLWSWRTSKCVSTYFFYAIMAYRPLGHNAQKVILCCDLLFSGLLVGIKPRKCNSPQVKRRWKLTCPYPLSHPTWWLSSLTSMRTTRLPLRRCSAHAAAPLCLPTLVCVATVVRMSISATSAGEQHTSSAAHYLSLLNSTKILETSTWK